MNDLPPHRTRRISLTKAQLRTELGAELLSLCESITADGQMAGEEISALRQWLEDSADCDLPAASYLRDVVQRVIADGAITREECHEIYRAVETILPPEVRRVAVAARRDAERANRLRNAPIARSNFMVAGCRYEGRPDVIRRHARAGGTVTLVRDRENRFSVNAIAVVLENGRQVGFVPEDDAEYLAPLIDQGAKASAELTKILTGGRSPIPIVDLRLYSADATIGTAVTSAMPDQGEPSAASEPAPGSVVWWLVGVVLFGAVLALFWLS